MFTIYIRVVDTEEKSWPNLGIPGKLYGGFIRQSQCRLHYANFKKDHHGEVVRLVVYVLDDYDNKERILKHSVEASDISGATNVTDSDRFTIHSVIPVGLRFIRNVT